MTQNKMQLQNQSQNGSLIDMQSRIDARKANFEKILPDGLTFERFRQAAVFAIAENKDLLECDPTSLIKAIMTAAQLGDHLGSAFNESYIYKRRNGRTGKYEAVLHRGYRGMQRGLIKAGFVDSVHTSVVYEHDEVEIYEHPPSLKHKIDPKTSDRGEWVGVISAGYKLNNGKQELVNYVYLTRARVETAKAQQKKKDIWEKHPEQMRKKVAVRALCQEFPVMNEEQAKMWTQDAEEINDSNAQGENHQTKAEVEKMRVEEMHESINFNAKRDTYPSEHTDIMPDKGIKSGVSLNVIAEQRGKNV